MIENLSFLKYHRYNSYLINKVRNDGYLELRDEISNLYINQIISVNVKDFIIIFYLFRCVTAPSNLQKPFNTDNVYIKR